jgi:hypothetical protein
MFVTPTRSSGGLILVHTIAPAEWPTIAPSSESAGDDASTGGITSSMRAAQLLLGNQQVLEHAEAGDLDTHAVAGFHPFARVA